MPTLKREFRVINESAYRSRGIFLWRYFDLHKFYSFLKTQEIRFTRMDDFEDPLEGVPISAIITFAEERDSRLIDELNFSELILDKTKFNKLTDGMQKKITGVIENQQHHFVSCWFLGKRESIAMWNLYSNPDGIAIKVPVRSMFNHFEDVSSSLFQQGISSFYGGKVTYQDFKSIDEYDEENKVSRIALRKDISYKHEEEFRFVIKTNPDGEDNVFFTTKIKDLKALNMKVFCHPLMAEWKRDNIWQILKEANLEQAFALSEIRLRKK